MVSHTVLPQKPQWCKLMCLVLLWCSVLMCITGPEVQLDWMFLQMSAEVLMCCSPPVDASPSTFFISQRGLLQLGWLSVTGTHPNYSCVKHFPVKRSIRDLTRCLKSHNETLTSKDLLSFKTWRHFRWELGCHLCTLTSTNCLQRVEKGHQQVHQHSQVEGDAAPEGHVPRAPVKDGLSCVSAD